MILNNTRLKNELNGIAKKNAEITDIIIFGSYTKGKNNPNDIDILVLFKDKINKETEYKVRKILEKYIKNISIISKTEKTLLDEGFDAREGILFEGKSLLTTKNIAENYGFKSFGGFKYDFKSQNNLQRTKFYYALNGRGTNQGASKTLECIKLSDSLIIVPVYNIDKFREFMDSWKIKYKYIPLLIPMRLGRKNILE